MAKICSSFVKFEFFTFEFVSYFDFRVSNFVAASRPQHIIHAVLSSGDSSALSADV